MNEAAASEQTEDMKNNELSSSSSSSSTSTANNNNPGADSTFPETPLHEMPFDWTTAAMEWPQSQFEAVPPPLLPFCQPSNPGSSQHNDMRVLGVDLDMLMQSESTEPFFEAMATPPPSPDSSSVVTVNKPNSMTFEITTPSQPQPRQPRLRPVPPHHMACHDYTNKVHYQMPSLEPAMRPPAPTPATLVTSTTCNKRLTRHVVYNSSRPSKYGRPPNPSGKTKTRKAKASIDDPDYLAHGTGIPR